MNAEHRSRLERAKRDHRRRVDLPRFQEGIRRAVGLDSIQLVDLEEGIQVQDRTYELIRAARAAGLLHLESGLSAAAVKPRLASMLNAVADVPLSIFFCHWQHVGGIVLSGREFATHALQLVEFDGDTVTAADREASIVVSLDRLVAADLVTYELDILGLERSM
jgi:hypothetical protein